MFEDLRKQVDESDDFENQTDDDYDSMGAYGYQQDHFLGMTPVQRFIIAVLLFMMVLISSAFCLLVTNKIIPPGLF